jgi:hypothetical protein
VAEQGAVSTDRVLITCPACGAHESADAAVVAGSPMIVCRECGGTWPAAPARTKRRTELSRLAAPQPPVPALLEAERRPFVTYSDGPGKAWIMKMEGDILPEKPTHRRLPLIFGGVVAAAFLAAFFGGREAAVASLPDLAGLYATLRLPVNLDRFAIEGLTAERAAEGERLIVEGSIRNLGATERDVPPLAASFYDAAAVPAGWHSFDATPAKLRGGEVAKFRVEFDDVPARATEVAVRFSDRRQLASMGIAAPGRSGSTPE